MRLDEYANYDGLGLAELIRKKEITATEVAELVSAGVERLNPEINAVIEVFENRVETPDEGLNPDGPFAGVPIFLKDLGASDAGRKQELGSRLCKGRVAGVTTYLTERFKQAGFNVMGRTTTSEFGQSGNTDSALMGRTRNPWDVTRSPGGSSGGTAAAVASGILPLSHGSDGGGSIRIPAASCGLVGLKPSRGRITLGPLRDESMFGLVVEFALSRSVRDTAALLDIVCRPAPGDPFVIAQPETPFSGQIGAPVEPLHIAFTTESWTGVEVDQEAVAGVKRIAAACEGMGHQVEESSLHFDENIYDQNIDVIWSASMADSCDRLADEMHRQISAETLDAVNLRAYRQAKRATAAELLAALASWNGVRRKVGQLFTHHDVLITPTINGPAVEKSFASTNQDITYEEWLIQEGQAWPFTGLFNVTGNPAISLPLMESESGLPIGIQFVSRFGDEGVLIRIASAFEEAMPWKDRIPAVHASSLSSAQGREVHS